MLDFAGISIFMFGNKVDPTSSGILQSGGMFEEFDIACAKGIKILPLGFTEHVARQLYDKVKASLSTYYPRATPAFSQLFDELGDGSRSLDDQMKTTLAALAELQKM
ncbi:MAG TPA: hypothetical protein DHV59_12745 [Oxalobacteraceae bacterium]|nr:hypothetical protein [Oxalobacteraceae bacterium]